MLSARVLVLPRQRLNRAARRCYSSNYWSTLQHQLPTVGRCCHSCLAPIRDPANLCAQLAFAAITGCQREATAATADPTPPLQTHNTSTHSAMPCWQDRKQGLPLLPPNSRPPTAEARVLATSLNVWGIYACAMAGQPVARKHLKCNSNALYDQTSQQMHHFVQSGGSIHICIMSTHSRYQG